MKKELLLACLCGMLAACGNIEKKAALQLQAARSACENGDYNEAKQRIDSIRILYPKAFDTRRESQRLLLEVELKEQEKTLAYLDSALDVKQKELDALKREFVLEKDTAYQQVGFYLHPSQVIEKNLHRSFLRFQTDETGKMSMTSVYCGANNIHHIAVKVSAPDGSFAETPASKNSYETADLGEKIEKANYKLGEDGDVIGFICMNRDRNLKVEYRGEHSYSTTMNAADRRAAAGICELAQVLASITEIRQNIGEANRKAEFVRHKLAQPRTEE